METAIIILLVAFAILEGLRPIETENKNGSN